MKPPSRRSSAATLALLLSSAPPACSDEDAPEALPLTLTSRAFADGEPIPPAHTCDGEGTAPDLSWSAGPPEIGSYVLILRDETAQVDHYAIYDIPADVDSLPEGLEAAHQPSTVPGARQTRGPFGFGYFGPCPIGGGSHVYAFELHALDIEALVEPGAIVDTTAVRAALAEHVLETAVLRGRYARP